MAAQQTTPEPAKRQVAAKVRVDELLNGGYMRGEGWQPSYVRTAGGESVYRANIIATVVAPSEDNSTPTVLVDDGSGSIALRAFGENSSLARLEVGDTVLVIGKPRGFDREIYLVPEIVRKLDNKGWVSVRKAELAHVHVSVPAAPVPADPVAPSMVKESQPTLERPVQNLTQRVYQLIREHDTGEGADVSLVVRLCQDPSAEKVISSLLLEGELYEIKRGRVKVLD